ncbi:MAG: 1-deoxy-D-xylulose-5-phosphate synthase N-terminal domain-containing protein, partial [Acidimicrobiia bacterium]
ASSTLDVLWTLYDRVLRIDPLDPGHSDRDRFFLSKGHGPMAYYAVLAAKGFIDAELLTSFAQFDSSLGHHPDRRLIPGVEISSGSLGMGIALGVGSALALSLDGSSARVFVMVGDGELDEGSNHEAIAVAGRLGLSNLIVIVIDNHSSTHGWPGGISSRFSVEGWHTVDVDGRSHDDIHAGLVVEHPTRPLAVVASVGGWDV